MTGRHRKLRKPIDGLSFLSGMTVGMAAFSLFFLALVLLEKM